MNNLPEPLAAALADRYRLERELGAGGMATVYLARDLRHGRNVAVKVLRPELAAIIGAERFLSEITTTANLQHPHILPLFDSGQAGGRSGGQEFLYYVMPYIEGETVRDRLDREKQLPIADAVRIANEVASALDYAHRHGIIHRDIKPGNILLLDGSALVADFGIALAASHAGGGRMTETGMSLGTPQYMSPEQAMGQREITARSDVYALGAVTYEMLLGEPPFTGPTAQSIVAKVMAEKPASLIARRERVPAEVEEAVLTALEKLPADRFGSAAEFAAALRAPAGTTSLRTPAARGARSPDWRLTAALGLLLGAAGAAAVLRGAESGEAGASGTRGQLTFNGRSRSPAISPDGDFVAFLEKRCPRGTFNPCTSSLIVQARGSDRPVAVLQGLADVRAPRFSPDGQSLLISARLDVDRAGLFVVPRLGGVPRQVGPPGVFDTHASGDSAMVVVTTPGGLKAVVIALSSGLVTDSVDLPGGNADGIAWSPDGGHLVVVEAGTLRIVRRDGTPRDSLRGGQRGTVRWTPDGRGFLVFEAGPVFEDDLVYHAVTADGRLSGQPEVRVAAIQTLFYGEFDVARRSGEVAVMSGRLTPDIWTFDLGAGAGPARRRTFSSTWFTHPALSPDGRRLFYMRGDAVGDNLYALGEDDSEEALTAERLTAGRSIAMSRDGRRVLFIHYPPGGRRFGVIELATRQSLSFTQPGVRALWTALAATGAVLHRTDSAGVLVRELPGDRVQLLTVPDSLRVTSFALEPSEDSLAVLVTGPSGPSLAVTPLGAWAPRWLHRFPADALPQSLSWTDDGNLYFLLWPAGEEAPGIWRIPSRGGRPYLVRTLPAGCEVAVVAFAAPRGACWVNDERADIWLLSVPGVTN